MCETHQGPFCLPVECPVFLKTKCINYEGENLPNTSINKNDTLLVALQKIDAAITGGGGGTGISGTFISPTVITVLNGLIVDIG